MIQDNIDRKKVARCVDHCSSELEARGICHNHAVNLILQSGKLHEIL